MKANIQATSGVVNTSALPDIYWTILEKAKDKLVRLGDVAEVRRGFTTGANEFFYLDAERIR